MSLTTAVAVMSMSALDRMRGVDVEHLLTNRWPGGLGIGPR
jgi:hypothetical protein